MVGKPDIRKLVWAVEEALKYRYFVVLTIAVLQRDPNAITFGPVVRHANVAIIPHKMKREAEIRFVNSLTWRFQSTVFVPT
jgi:hypothetical protein